MGSGFDINRSVVIKEENLFCVSEPDGSIPGPGPHPFGVFYEDCRFICGWELEVLGEPPCALACSARDRHLALYDLTNDEVTIAGGRRLEPQAIQIQLERELRRPRTIDERITLQSFAEDPVEAAVGVRVRSGFEPMLWIRGLVDSFEPKRAKTLARAGRVHSSTHGRDGVERRLETVASPRPRTTRAGLEWKLRLRRGDRQTIALRHVLSEGATVSGLRVGPASVHLRFTRDGDAVAVADARVEGDVDVVIDLERAHHPNLDR